MNDTTRFGSLAAAADRYGKLSLENYAIIRNVAENVSIGFCRYLGAPGGICVYLVPPEGEWSPQPYGSGAFSVSGAGFLPLGPIAFGLAVKVSATGDWVRLVITCSKKGQHVEVSIRDGSTFDLALPVEEAELVELFARLHGHLVKWFDDQSETYEHGDYGGRSIGFDILHSPDGAEAENG